MLEEDFDAASTLEESGLPEELADKALKLYEQGAVKAKSIKALAQFKPALRGRLEPDGLTSRPTGILVAEWRVSKNGSRYKVVL